ncbi:hypothetical protein P691DRAFT_421254 [Macrolepiota fuliginosa MF-IS2]|uniref:Uncharacterized protein n=1 Tax=Macrolepiota fuliginosa MF-IS2 TaxID=1400762 RepID=A0A9P6BZD2_9AGAR|nr:hypothetical protein P691DRAFT_421254 [Macrolepiota fuliginosa MF-IS2]
MSTQNSSPQKPRPQDTDVERNVINATSSESTSTDQQPSPRTSTPNVDQKPTESSASTRIHSRSPPPGTISMSGLRTALPDIALNSPSTNIIGTPFAHTASNTPFEYPFPDTSTESSPSPPSHPSYRPGSPHGNFHPPPHPGFHPPPSGDIQPPSSGTFNLLHPKFRAAAPASPPPMPPSLKKKRWSLNILGRKRGGDPSTPTGEVPPSPLGAPPAVTSGAILGGLGSGRPRLGDRSSSGGIRPSDDPRKGADKN